VVAALLLLCGAAAFPLWRRLQARRRMQSLHQCDVLVVGSSVAWGTGATGPMWAPRRHPRGVGYAELLRGALSGRLGLSMCNAAVGGDHTGRCLRMLRAALPVCKPRWVVVGLSLGNEGLPWTRDAAEAEALVDRYIAAVRQIAAAAASAGAQVVVGGVYPHGRYRPHHLHALRRADAALASAGGLRVVSWLAALDGGGGRWKAELEADFAHPNEHGHRLMFEAFEARLSELFAADGGGAQGARSGSEGGTSEQKRGAKARPKPKPALRQRAQETPMLDGERDGLLDTADASVRSSAG
jgi:lysophospholipase L1-like esterase